MRSPFTDKEMKLEYEKRTWKFRGEEYDYIHTSWLCEDTGERFTTDDTDTAGFIQVTNQYRTKYGIPFTDEIVAVRKKYNISASKMSLILGFGTNQWRHYEAGEVPSVSNGRMIRSIMNPDVFIDMVHSSKHILQPKDYEKIIRQSDVSPLHPEY
jgi:DNA-binding transcriptional regulator YiaG